MTSDKKGRAIASSSKQVGKVLTSSGTKDLSEREWRSKRRRRVQVNFISLIKVFYLGGVRGQTTID